MKRILFFVCLLSTILMSAQDYKTCGTDEMMEKVFEAEPTLRKKTKLLKPPKRINVLDIDIRSQANWFDVLI